VAMSRKDFEAIADAINWNTKTRAEARKVVEVIAPALKRSAGLTPNGNSRFDEDKFLAASTERYGYRKG
jgi:hypothetical protein